MLLKKPIISIQEIVISVFVALAILIFGNHAPVYGQSVKQKTEQTETYITDTKLRLFIQAQEAIEYVQKQYQEGAQSDNTLKGTMAEEVIRTIKAYGLSVNEYNKILADIQDTDTEIGQRYSEMIKME